MAKRISNKINAKDLEYTNFAFWMWWCPGLLAVIGGFAYSLRLLSLTMIGILWSTLVIWMGIGCFINGRHCGRVHCKIDGILFPVLGIVGFFEVFGIIAAFNWNYYWLIFFAILFGSFLVEALWKKYV